MILGSAIRVWPPLLVKDYGAPVGSNGRSAGDLSSEAAASGLVDLEICLGVDRM